MTLQSVYACGEGWPCLECGQWIDGHALRGELGHYHPHCVCTWCSEPLQGNALPFMSQHVHPDCLSLARDEMQQEINRRDDINARQIPEWNEP